MKFFAVVPALLSAVAAEAQLPIAPQFLSQAGLYRGAFPALPYASAYSAPYSAPAHFAYGAPITALTASSAPAPAVAYTAAVPAVAAPVIAKAVAAPVIAKAVPAVAAPVIAKAAPITTAHSSQYQAQDELGNIAYGYQNINSAKQETGNAYGGVTGSYTYTDEAGVHTVNYVADDLGFRVTSDNLPVGPANLAVAPVHVAEPVQDTPAVVEAKAAFFKAYNAAKSGVVKRSAQNILPQTYAGLPAFNYAGLQPYGVVGSLVGHANGAVVPVDTAEVHAAKVAHAAAGGAIHSAPLAYNLAPAPLTATYAAAPAAPVTYSGVSALSYAAAPEAALREATLTTIKLNPGHATFYRVD